MLKKIRIRKWMIIAGSILILALLVGGIIYMFGDHYVNIKGQRLNQFGYSTGGGMTGGYYSETVKRCEDGALITVKQAEWHSQAPKIREYQVDSLLLDELESIVRRKRMNFWNRKKFTNMFVYDGESQSYSFRFDSADLSFSSQIYPPRYGNKLDKLHEAIDRYLENAEALPGFVSEDIDAEETYEISEGEVKLTVVSYGAGALWVTAVNGTEEEVELPTAFRLISADTGELVEEQTEGEPNTLYPKMMDSFSYTLQDRLGAGNYKLILGETELAFEIR